MSLLKKIIDVKKKGFEIQFAEDGETSMFVGLTTWAEQGGEKRIVDGSFMVDMDMAYHYRGGIDDYMVLEIDRHLENVFTFLNKEGVSQTSPP